MVDLRQHLLPIKDQGTRGTCVAFAATAAHEHLWSDGIDLSEEFLFWAAKQRDGHPRVDATTLSAVAHALADLGQPPEVVWPYDDRRSHLDPAYQPPPAAFVAGPDHRPGLGRGVAPTVLALRAVLNQGVLPLLTFFLYDTWFTVKSDGRIAMPAPGATQRGGHAVLVVGYDDAEGHFIVRNSWGADWGDAGYGFLPFLYIDAHGRDARCLSK